ncbi:MAG: HAD family hydrolase, partial [Anaerolineales bacterium]
MRFKSVQLEAIIFDLGSTLLYFDADWMEVVQESNARLLQALRDAEIVVDEQTFTDRFRAMLQDYYLERDTEFIEYTSGYILRQTLAEYGYATVPDSVIKKILAAMYSATQAHWKPDPEAHSTLKAVQEMGYRLGLISNASDNADVQALLDKAGLRDYFETILTSAAEGIRKPHPQIFWTALNHMDTHPSRAAMVGDTLGADILGAHHAGMLGIYVTR